MRSMPWIVVAVLLGLGTIDETAGEARVASDADVRVSEIHETETTTFRSRILDEERTLFVRKPRGYDDDTRRYPVLFVLDADWHFNIAAADVELLSECSYISPHPAPPMLVVGVANVDRNRDFTPTHRPAQHGMSFPTSGGAGAFRRFLVEEAIPLVDERYRAAPFRILAGWSLGGLFTVNTLLSDTPVFDSYLAISPSLWWDDDLTRRDLVAGATLDSTRVRQLIVTLGTTEEANSTSVARSTREFLERLEIDPLEHVAVEKVEIQGLGHNLAPKMAYFEGLAAIFADWTLPAETLDKGLAAIDAYYAALTERYRLEVPVPEDVYGALGWRLFEAGRREESGDVFRRWVGRHPESSVALASLGSYHRETGDKETALALLRRAVTLEEGSTHPRASFLQDLRRDIAAMEGGD